MNLELKDEIFPASVTPYLRRHSLQNFSKIPIVSPQTCHITLQTLHGFGHSGLLLAFLTFPIFLFRPHRQAAGFLTCNRHITPYTTDCIAHSGVQPDFSSHSRCNRYFSNCNRNFAVAALCHAPVVTLL